MSTGGSRLVVVAELLKSQEGENENTIIHLARCVRFAKFVFCLLVVLD